MPGLTPLAVAAVTSSTANVVRLLAAGATVNALSRCRPRVLEFYGVPWINDLVYYELHNP